jgi:hypothetical protein
MKRLRQYNSIRVNEGYLLDDGQSGYGVVYFLFGWIGVLLKQLYRHTFQPLMSQARGSARQRKYDRILEKHPNSLICPYCSYILKRT